MNDTPPKSSFELAMERLRKKDKQDGVEQRTLTDEQKAAIADIRRTYEAKLAQEEIMHRAALIRLFDPEAIATLEAEHQHQRVRLNAEREEKIEKIRTQAT